MEFDPEKIYLAVNEAGDDWADKKAAYQAFDDNTKTILADIQTDYMDGAKTSKNEAEMRALCSTVFKEHLAAKQKARRGWLVAEAKYNDLKMFAELRRSQESTRRAEMRIL